MIVCVLLLSMACANPKTEKPIVELSCGQCRFGLTSEKGCSLAARIDGESYFVDGADIDDFGDAHDEKIGFCEVIRKAEVEGEVVDNRFKMTTVEMLD
jgi:hypothetical protein